MVMMRKVGEILKSTREQKRMPLEYVSEITKIKITYLKAIEESNYAALPQAPFTKGLLRNYAQFLGLNADDLLARFRREYDEKKEVLHVIPRFSVESFFHLTPASIVRYFIILVLIGLFGYFLFQFRILTGPPLLQVLSPIENAIITEDTITVSGKTAEEANVTVNGEPVTVGTGGAFAASIDIVLPANVKERAIEITVAATGKTKKTSTKTITVIIRRP